MKSMPCFLRLAADFAGSNSKSIRYRKYTRTTRGEGHAGDEPRRDLGEHRGLLRGGPGPAPPTSKFDRNFFCCRDLVDRVEGRGGVPGGVKGLVPELAVGPLDVHEEPRRRSPFAVRAKLDTLGRLESSDVNATVVTPSVGVGRSFGLFGRTAQAFAVLPFSSADASGKVGGADATTSRAGLSDMRLRLSWLVRGAPAGSVVDVAKAPRRRILGMSLNVAAPTGEYFPDKLITRRCEGAIVRWCEGTDRWCGVRDFELMPCRTVGPPQ